MPLVIDSAQVVIPLIGIIVENLVRFQATVTLRLRGDVFIVGRRIRVFLYDAPEISFPFQSVLFIVLECAEKRIAVRIYRFDALQLVVLAFQKTNGARLVDNLRHP